MKSKDTYKSLDTLDVKGKKYQFYNLQKAEKNGLEGISKLPKSLKVLLENLLRYEDDKTVDTKQIKAIQYWLKNKTSDTEIAYRPARVLLQDYTGIPSVADLAAMREAVQKKIRTRNQLTHCPKLIWLSTIQYKLIIQEKMLWL